MFQTAPFTCAATGIGSAGQWVAFQSSHVRVGWTNSGVVTSCLSVPRTFEGVGTVSFYDPDPGTRLRNMCSNNAAVAWVPDQCQMVSQSDVSSVFWLIGAALVAVAVIEFVKKAALHDS